jgi:hypothetical protein
MKNIQNPGDMTLNSLKHNRNRHARCLAMLFYNTFPSVNVSVVIDVGH